MIHVSDFSESTRSSKDDGDGDEDNDLTAADQSSTGGGDDEENGEGKHPSSSAPSPAAAGNTEATKNVQLNGGSNEHEEGLIDNVTRDAAPASYSPEINGFMDVSSERSYDTLPPDTNRFETVPKHNRRPHRLGQTRLPVQLNSFQSINGRQHEELIAQQWLTNEPSANYLPHGYPLGNMHAQQHITPDFRMSTANMMQEEMQDIGGVNGLPLVNGMCYEDFPSHTRGMPMRTMSTPHHIMLDHSEMQASHGLGVGQPGFYSS